jgi:molybdate transport system substrate-binding protein
MRRVLACLTVLLALAACAPEREPPLSGGLTIFASTSLTEALTSMEQGFETTYPGVRVDIVFGSDSELARRSAQGPAPDLLVLEGPAPLAAAGPTGPPVLFARNQFVLAVAADNPKGIVRLDDLDRPDVRVALCAGTEPCGTVAASVLAAAGVTVPATASQVGDVRSALAEVTAGTADVALVYRSDARLAGDTVATIEFPESRTALAEYQAAVPTAAANPQAAAAFLAYLTAPATTDALVTAGFRPLT